MPIQDASYPARSRVATPQAANGYLAGPYPRDTPYVGPNGPRLLGITSAEGLYPRRAPKTSVWV